MKIFESHAHLDFPDFNQDREEVIRKCLLEGIERIINIGINKETSLKSIALAEKFAEIFCAVGYHPHDSKTYSSEQLRKLADHKKVVAIGEIGLDYYRNYSPREVQKQVFSDQIQIALELGLPIVVHDREAHEDCLKLLQKFKPPKVVFHCFSGDLAMAREIVNKGWFVSFTGTVTYKNSKSAEVVRNLSLENFFLETDCPFLSPVPYRGKRNSPLNLRYIIEKIAELKNVTPKLVAAKTFENAVEFFQV